MSAGRSLCASLFAVTLWAGAGHCQEKISVQPDLRPSAKAPNEFTAETASPKKTIIIESLCLQVPRGFCEKAGLADDASSQPDATSCKLGVWILTPREARMFANLVNLEPAHHFVCRPKMQTLDGQNAEANIGQKLDIVTGLEATMIDGKTGLLPKICSAWLGESLKITPNVVAEKDSINLDVEASSSSQPTGTLVELPVSQSPKESASGSIQPVLYIRPKSSKPTLDIQSLHTTVEVADGGTAVLRTAFSKPTDDPHATETLWILKSRILPAK